MTYISSEILPDEAKLALLHTNADDLPALTLVFDLDIRLSRIVSATTEPMLGQMRLAWWRDMLNAEMPDRPSGDAVLDGIGKHWAGREHALIPLVDGWEHLLGEPPLNGDDAAMFAHGRRDALLAAYGVSAGDAQYAAHAIAAMRWAMADLASKVSLDEERDVLLAHALGELDLGNDGAEKRLPHSARGLVVLGALGLRALKRGGRPLMEGRTASLTAMRAALLRR